MDSHAAGRIAETADAVDVVVTQVRAVGGALHDTVVSDRLIVEEPLSIRLDDTLVTTTMRTPGHDVELAVGFCFTEGLLHGEPVVGVGDPFADGRNTVTVRTDHRAPVPTPRLGTTSSSCGWCGNEQLEALVARLAAGRVGDGDRSSRADGGRREDAATAGPVRRHRCRSLCGRVRRRGEHPGAPRGRRQTQRRRQGRRAAASRRSHDGARPAGVCS